MSIHVNTTVDAFLESSASNLLPVDTSYVGYEWERITSSTAPVNWTGGVRAEFSLPQYEDSVWETDNMYIDCVAELKVVNSTGDDSKHPQPYCTVAIEQFFSSSLLENFQVSFGGVELQNLQSPSNAYPYLNGVYTLLNNRSAKTGGNARILNTLYPADPKGDVGNVNTASSLEENIIRHDDIINDASDPYDLCVDKQYQGNVEDGFQFPCNVQGTDFKLYTSRLSSNYVYRNKCAIGYSRVPDDAATAPESYKFRFLMKLKDGFLNSPYKKPANIPLKISLTRNRNLHYSLCGDAVTDAVLSRVTTPGATPTYSLAFDRMDLFCKRLMLSNNQLQVYRSNPMLLYDMPRYTAQVFNFTSKSVNINTNWTKSPQALFISIVPADSLEPTLGGAFKKSGSAFSSANRKQCDFEELSINTSIGQIPKEKYQLRDTVSGVGAHSVGGVRRAYEDFKMACISPDDCISYMQWFENMRIYGFIINSDQHNPHYVNTNPSRSSININATIYLEEGLAGTDFTKYRLVVIGLMYGQLGIADLKSVFIQS